MKRFSRRKKNPLQQEIIVDNITYEIYNDPVDILNILAEEMQLVKPDTEATEASDDFVPFEIISGVMSGNNVEYVKDNYTETTYHVSANTIIELLKQIHDLGYNLKDLQKVLEKYTKY